MKVRERIEYYFPNTRAGNNVARQFARRRRDQGCLSSFHSVGAYVVVVSEIEFNLSDDEVEEHDETTKA